MYATIVWSSSLTKSALMNKLSHLSSLQGSFQAIHKVCGIAVGAKAEVEEPAAQQPAIAAAAAAPAKKKRSNA